MGGMHAWMWAEMYPDLMDGVIPLSCQPVEISGRNWLGRRAAAEAIRNDPDWNGGFFDSPPRHYIYSAAGPLHNQKPPPHPKKAPPPGAPPAPFQQRLARAGQNPPHS